MNLKATHALGRTAGAAGWLAAALAVAIVSGTARADGSAWFDAGIRDYETWPADGAPLEVLGAGVWQGTAGAW